MPRLTLRYREGDIFTVPIEGGLAVGVVARADGVSCILGYYFFLHDLTELEQLRPENAVFITRGSDLSLMGDGRSRRSAKTEPRWKVIGHLGDFTRAAWPVPAFARFGQVVYYDDDANHELRAEKDAAKAAGLPEDGSAGSGAVETCLKQLLALRRNGQAAVA